MNNDWSVYELTLLYFFPEESGPTENNLRGFWKDQNDPWWHELVRREKNRDAGILVQESGWPVRQIASDLKERYAGK